MQFDTLPCEVCGSTDYIESASVGSLICSVCGNVSAANAVMELDVDDGLAITMNRASIVRVGSQEASASSRKRFAADTRSSADLLRALTLMLEHVAGEVEGKLDLIGMERDGYKERVLRSWNSFVVDCQKMHVKGGGVFVNRKKKVVNQEPSPPPLPPPDPIPHVLPPALMPSPSGTRKRVFFADESKISNPPSKFQATQSTAVGSQPCDLEIYSQDIEVDAIVPQLARDEVEQVGLIPNWSSLHALLLSGLPGRLTASQFLRFLWRNEISMFSAPKRAGLPEELERSDFNCEMAVGSVRSLLRPDRWLNACDLSEVFETWKLRDNISFAETPSSWIPMLTLFLERIDRSICSATGKIACEILEVLVDLEISSDFTAVSSLTPETPEKQIVSELVGKVFSDSQEIERELIRLEGSLVGDWPLDMTVAAAVLVASEISNSQSPCTVSDPLSLSGWLQLSGTGRDSLTRWVEGEMYDHGNLSVFAEICQVLKESTLSLTDLDSSADNSVGWVQVDECNGHYWRRLHALAADLPTYRRSLKAASRQLHNAAIFLKKWWQNRQPSSP